MADKLSETTWTAFLKKQKLDLDDKALVKALVAFDKTDESKPEPRLKALEEVIKQIPEQVKALVKRKKELGDKPFGLVKDQLYELLEQAEQLHKKTQAAAAEAEKEEEDDEPGNVLLEPKRLLAMLQRCKRDPELSVNFGFVDAKDKQPAAFAMHPRMSGKKLYAALQTETGVKTGAFGTAWVQVDGEFKGTCLMLQLDKPLSGLVKKVKAPVKAAGFKIAKAVLWSADGTVFEQEDETDEPAAPGAGAAGTAASGAAAAGAGAAGTGSRPAPPKPTDKPATPTQAPARSPDMETFLARLKALVELASAAGDTPAAKQAKLWGSEAGMYSRKGDWARVDELMKQAEALLSGTKPTAPGAAPATKPAAATTTHTAPVSQKVAFTQTRLAWEQTRNHVRAELKKLQEQMLADMKDDPDFANLSKNSTVLYRPLEKLDERLMDKLDDALNATTSEQRNASHQAALKIVDEYMAFAKTDTLLHDICDNGFVDVDIEAVLVERLTAMAAQLKTAMAA